MPESFGVHFDGVVYGPFESDEAAKAWADRQVLLADAGNPSAPSGQSSRSSPRSGTRISLTTN